MQRIISCFYKIYTEKSVPNNKEYSGYFYKNGSLICDYCHMQQITRDRCCNCDRPIQKKQKNKFYIQKGDRHSSHDFTNIFYSFHTHIPLKEYDYTQSNMSVPSGLDMAILSKNENKLISPIYFTHYIIGNMGIWVIKRSNNYHEKLYWPIFLYYQILKILFIQKNKYLGFDNNSYTKSLNNYLFYANNINITKLQKVVNLLKTHDHSKYTQIKGTLKSKNINQIHELVIANQPSYFRLSFIPWTPSIDSKSCSQNVH